MGDHIEEEEERQCLSVTATPCWSCCFLNFFQDEKRQKCSCLLSSVSHYPADLSKRSLVHNSFLLLCKLSPRDDLILWIQQDYSLSCSAFYYWGHGRLNLRQPTKDLINRACHFGLGATLTWLQSIQLAHIWLGLCSAGQSSLETAT